MDNTYPKQERDKMSENHVPEAKSSPPGINPRLGELSPDAILTKEGMAHLFSCCERTIERAVERDELPPPTRMFAKKTWTAGAVIEFINERLKEAATERAAMARKIQKLSP